MESILNLIFQAENVRMLVILAFVYCAYVLNNRKMDRMESTLNRRIDGVESSLSKQIDELRVDMNGQINELKHNDIAHLNSTIEALTYALEKNGSLKKEDKDYVDSRLAR
jgi:ribosomal protein S13